MKNRIFSHPNAKKTFRKIKKDTGLFSPWKMSFTLAVNEKKILRIKPCTGSKLKEITVQRRLCPYLGSKNPPITLTNNNNNKKRISTLFVQSLKANKTRCLWNIYERDETDTWSAKCICYLLLWLLILNDVLSEEGLEEVNVSFVLENFFDNRAHSSKATWHDKYYK